MDLKDVVGVIAFLLFMVNVFLALIIMYLKDIWEVVKRG